MNGRIEHDGEVTGKWQLLLRFERTVQWKQDVPDAFTEIVVPPDGDYRTGCLGNDPVGIASDSVLFIPRYTVCTRKN